MAEIKNQNPLTLKDLADYNQEILLPALEKRFVLKGEFDELKTDVNILKTDVNILKTDVSVLKTDVNMLKTDVKILKIDVSELRREFNKSRGEFKSFRDEVFTGQDAILKKLDILLTEKTIREYQEEKKEKLWRIVLSALESHHILSIKELKKISNLKLF